jgi:cytochrome c-type biogenesis protein CcsB
MTEQTGAILFRTAFWVYLLATASYVGFVAKRMKAWGSIGRALLCVGLVLHTASLVVRTIATGHPPFLNLYEYMLSFTWGAVVVYLVLERVAKSQSFGAFVVPLITAFCFLTYRLPSKVEHIMPALRSAWRIPHIASAVLAYASFTVAFVIAILYLVRERAEGNPSSFWNSRLPALKTLDQTIYRTIAFGFLMQTTLVIMGAIWAQYAWGRYWGWDPKETWSLITRFI